MFIFHVTNIKLFFLHNWLGVWQRSRPDFKGQNLKKEKSFEEITWENYPLSDSNIFLVRKLAAQRIQERFLESEHLRDIQI